MNDRDFASVTQLSPAMQPNRPSAPRKPLILGLAAAFALIAAAAYVIIAEFFDRSFSTDRDVARVLGLPVMASIPEARKV